MIAVMGRDAKVHNIDRGGGGRRRVDDDKITGAHCFV